MGGHIPRYICGGQRTPCQSASQKLNLYCLDWSVFWLSHFTSPSWFWVKQVLPHLAITFLEICWVDVCACPGPVVELMMCRSRVHPLPPLPKGLGLRLWETDACEVDCALLMLHQTGIGLCSLRSTGSQGVQASLPGSQAPRHSIGLLHCPLWQILKKISGPLFKDVYCCGRK